MGDRRQQDDGPETPAWIVSFADMITLLLAFFVLLQSFAKEQDPELFRRGQGAFIRSISGFGIPDLLFGKPQVLDGPSHKKRHPTKENDEKKKNRQRVIDTRDTEIRKAFERLKRAVDAEHLNPDRGVQRVVWPSIQFEPGSDVLNAEARKYLTQRAREWGMELNPRKAMISVVAFSPDRPNNGQARWTLAANRASAVSDFIRDVLSSVSDRRWNLVATGTAETPDRAPGIAAPTQAEFVRIIITGVE